MINTHKIIAVNGHYEVYDGFGQFVMSGDTYSECEKELDKIFAEISVAKL